MTAPVAPPRPAETSASQSVARRLARLGRWSKALILMLGSLITVGLDILRLPDHTQIFTAILPYRFLTAELGWVNSLPYLWQQGSLSGRDFHFTYGPLAQFIAWLGAQLSLTRTPFDAFPLVLFAFMVAGLVLFLVLLGLLPQLRGRHTLLVFLVLFGLQSVILDPLGYRFLVGPLFVAILTYAAATRSARRAALLAALASIVGFLGQLVTAEVGLLVLAAASVSLGAYTLLALRPGLLDRADLQPPRRYLLLLATVVGTLALCNLAVSLVFKLTSANYVGLFDYQWYAWESIRGYNYTMAYRWEMESWQTRSLALMIAAVIGYVTLNVRRFTTSDGFLLLGLLVMAVLQFKSALIRSDIFHIMTGMTTFLLLFLFLVHDWARLGRWHAAWLAVWTVVLVLFLRAWPWTDTDLFPKVARLLTAPLAPVTYLHYLASLAIPPSSFSPAGLIDLGDPTPILNFPYENHMGLAAGRPLVAPVLQVYAAHTEALQRRYVQLLDRQPASLEITYGLDNLGSVAVDAVRHVTRAPIIFEYLYRHFELETGRPFGSFYRLRRRAQPAELTVTPIATTVRPSESGRLVLTAQEPSQCSLLRLSLSLTYPPTSLLGRPNPINVTVMAGDRYLNSTHLVAIEANREFSTYISLMDDYRFAEVFGPSGAQVKAWDTLDLTAVPTGLFQVPPRQIAVRQVECITIPVTGPPLPTTAAPVDASVPPLYEGYLETVSCGSDIAGWVWDVNRPQAAVQVDVYVDERVAATATADQYRPDLPAVGKGTGRYVFHAPLPAEMRDNRPHQIQVRPHGSSLILVQPPPPLTCPGP